MNFDLRNAPRKIEIRDLAYEILRNTPGVMTMAEAIVRATAIVNAKGGK